MGYSVSPSPGTGRRVVERERSRRGKVGAGLLKTAVNAVVQNPFGRYFAGPLVVRFAAAVCAGVLVAALIDLTLAPPSPALVYLAVGALAGGGAGGAGGALVGACWGWLAGEIADAALSSAAAEPATRYFPDLVAWGSATVAGWLGGTATRRCFDLLVRRVPGGVVRALEGLLLTTVLASVSILVSFKLGLLV